MKKSMNTSAFKVLIGLFLLVTTFGLKAQDPRSVIFTAAGNKVTVDEFERQFLKNINLEDEKITAAQIDEYLDLYIKFKLKIQDAHDAGLDTARNYRDELQMYRDQLARNYLYDREVTDALIKEAYDRLQWELAVSHILITIAPDAGPADTLIAFNKIKNIGDQLLKDPSAFESLARENSDDPGSKDNGGNLGYMTALQVVYPFENMAYNTPMGSVSRIFRTEFGYHILKVTDKRANRGEIKMRHLMLRVGTTPEATADAVKAKINEIYQRLKSGESTLASMARNYSEDYNSRYQDGEMDFVSATQFIGDLDRQKWVDKGFSLSNPGDICEPFQTSYGWHILQKVAVRPLGPFEQMRVVLKNQVQGDRRAQKSVDALVEKVKAENGFKEYPEALKALESSLDSTYIKGTFKKAGLPMYARGAKTQETIKATRNLQQPLLDLNLYVLGGKNYTVGEFATELESISRPVTGNVAEHLNTQYKAWVSKNCVTYQDAHLEEKSAEFRNIYQEYREGILMFNRMQELVWEKANTDSVGLDKFYNQHKTDYTWGDRFDAEIYLCASQDIMNRVAKSVRKKIAADSIRRAENKTNQLNLDFRIGKYELADSFLFPDKRILETLFADPKYRAKSDKVYTLNKIGKDWVVVKVVKFLPASSKTLSETRGPVASKYQETLEKEWMDALKSKYTVEVNEPVLNELKKRLAK
ncbi:MAG: peptidylprolyl isomerase [Bacteroidetes bacterium]|nr:peptidylprolyl isomerase [Bacteroidota bacterium]